MLDLADPLAGEVERAADLLEGVLFGPLEAIAEPEHLGLPLGEVVDGVEQAAPPLGPLGLLVGARRAVISDEVAQHPVLFSAHRRLEAHRLSDHAANLVDPLEREVEALDGLLSGGLAAVILAEVAAEPVEPAHVLEHVGRHPDGPSLITGRPGDGLSDPPGGVGGELVAQPVLKPLDRSHQPQAPLLDQVGVQLAAGGVLRGDVDHQREVGLEEVAPRRAGALLAGRRPAAEGVELGEVHFGVELASLEQLEVVLQQRHQPEPAQWELVDERGQPLAVVVLGELGRVLGGALEPGPSLPLVGPGHVEHLPAPKLSPDDLTCHLGERQGDHRRSRQGFAHRDLSLFELTAKLDFAFPSQKGALFGHFLQQHRSNFTL